MGGFSHAKRKPALPEQRGEVERKKENTQNRRCAVHILYQIQRPESY